MLMRTLLLLALVLAVVLWWKHHQRGRSGPTPPAPPQPKPGAEPMRRCAECGLHMPLSQALPGKGGDFCSAEHRERHEARV